MNQNRRRFLRKVPDEFTVIQIERDEVGKVLNVSEGGLSFSSVSPVPRNLPVYFWFSFNLKDRIEAMGEVTWTDTSRTIGGIRFTQLSPVNREQIRKWLARLNPEQVPDVEPVAQRILTSKPVSSGMNTLDRVAKFVAKARAYRPSFSPKEGAAGIPKAAPSASPEFEPPKVRAGRSLDYSERTDPTAFNPPLPPASGIEPADGRVNPLIFGLRGADLPVSKVEPRPSLGIEPLKKRADHSILTLEEPELPTAAVAPPPAVKVEPPKSRPASVLTLESTDSLDSKPVPPPALGMEAGKGRSLRSLFSREAAPSLAGQSGDSKFSSFSFRGLESLVELVPLQRHLSAKKRQLLCGVLLGVCLSAAVMLPVMKFWSSRAQADIKPAAIASPGLKSSSNDVPPQVPVTVPAATVQNKPSYPVAGIFSDPIPPRSIPLKKGTTPILSARSAPADFYRQNLPKTVAAKATKQTAGTPSQKPSKDDSPANKTSGMNPNQLWTEVQAGNSKAAVELAELYIKGNGVPRNCQQARVLLLVASEKRNTAAIKRLHDLDKGAACP